MSHMLREAKIGDVFRIANSSWKARDIFFSGSYRPNPYENVVYYNFLYWGEFSQREYDKLPGVTQSFQWQTSDFFLYKEKIIQSLSKIEAEDYSMFYPPLPRRFTENLSIKTPWFALCGYQIGIQDTCSQEELDMYYDIIKLKEVIPSYTLHQPALPKRKEVIIHV